MSDILKRLSDKIKEIAVDNKLCIAFSGGVDSTVLLKVAVDAGVQVLAVTFNTQLTASMINIENAEKTARKMGAEQHTLSFNALADENIANNGKLRCYHCKRAMFSALRAFADSKGYKALCDGTNADDLKEYRPGLKARDELAVRSPIAECGLTKNQVREIAAELGLSVAVKPSAPCLLTRFSYDTPITDTLLDTVEQGEKILKSYGFLSCRLRIHNDVARIEVPKSDFEEMLKVCGKLSLELKKLGLKYITLDLEGLRSGSMDI